MAAVNWLGGSALAAEFLGIGIDFLENQVMRWNHNSNPFIFLIAIALFKLLRQKKFVNNTANKLSTLSMLLSVVYKYTIQKIVSRLANSVVRKYAETVDHLIEKR